MKLKKGDQILIIKGKDRGRKGKIIKVLPEERKILAEGLNLRKKHIRPKKEGEKGQVVEVSSFFNSSNAKLICPKCKKPTRIGYNLRDGKKYRSCKKCKKEFS